MPNEENFAAQNGSKPTTYQKISAIIITYNEENNIRRCLESLQGVADEIVVVDSLSSDNTEMICMEYQVKFISQKFLGYRDQKNFALDQTKYDYVLSLDADESLSDEAREIVIREKNHMVYDAYRFNRYNNYSGKWLKHGLWYPDTKTRLWNKHKARFGGLNIHEYVDIKKSHSVKHLNCDILHYPYRTVHEHLLQMMRFAKIYGESAFEEGKKKNSILLNLILSPLFKFIKGYFFKLGFLDGYYGFIVAVNTAILNYFKYLYLLELNRKKGLEGERVSVIFSTYNNVDWLEKTIIGFSNQTYKNFEIVIADDGSSPETKAKIQELRHTTGMEIIHVWQEDQGFQKSSILNRAIKASHCDYLIFTDGDCVPRKDFIEKHLAHAQKGYFLSGGYFKLPMDTSIKITKEDILSGNAFDSKWLQQNGLKWTYKLLKLTSNGWTERALNHYTTAKAPWNGHNSSGWKKDILSVNGFDERMGYGGQDRELGERLINKGIKSKQIRYSAICIHLDHPRSYAVRESIEKNLMIRKNTRKNKIIWTPYGIDKTA